MKALVLNSFGSTPELIDREIPTPGAHEVRVRVRAATVNGFDLAVAAGYLDGVLEHRFPLVLGKDFAGTIEAVGTGVEGYAVGDRVFGVVNKPYQGEGSFAEYVTVLVDCLALIPDGVGFAEAASLGLAGAAAMDAFDAASLKAGDSVLIAGATGGVGSLLIQLATSVGARVIATAHTEQEITHVRDLGAVETIDYKEDVSAAMQTQQPHGVDVVFHLVGDPQALAGVIKPKGRLVSTLLQSPDQVDADSATVIAVVASPKTNTLDRLARAHADGVLRVMIDQAYPLGEGAAALTHFGRGTIGKILLMT